MGEQQAKACDQPIDVVQNATLKRGARSKGDGDLSPLEIEGNILQKGKWYSKCLKKTASLLLAVSLAASLAVGMSACGKGSDNASARQKRRFIYGDGDRRQFGAKMARSR